MAMCAIAQHFGRPGTPTDQAWIESLFSHLKAEWPHLDHISDPSELRAELARVRVEYNTIWFASDSMRQIRVLIRPHLAGAGALRGGGFKDDRARTCREQWGPSPQAVPLAVGEV
jgi:transposase InsO family protein